MHICAENLLELSFFYQYAHMGAKKITVSKTFMKPAGIFTSVSSTKTLLKY